MNKRTARLIAWSLVVVFVILATAGLALQALANTSYTSIGIPMLIIMLILAGVWPVIGALIVSRHPHHPVGWLLCLGITSAAIDMFSTGYISYGTNVYAGSLPGVTLALLWLSWGGAFPISIVVFTLIMLLFPNGRLPGPGWRMAAWTAVGALLLYLPLGALRPGPVDPSSDIFVDNPLTVSASIWLSLEPLMWTAFVILVLCYAAGLISLIVRLRRAQQDERQQIKWLVYPAALYGLVLPLLGLASRQDNALALGIGLALGVPAIMGILIAVAFAIFKYRLYDIDIIVNRTLVYGALTGTLALVYFASIVLLQLILPAESPIAIVLSTLAVAALFSPMRRRIQNVIDRRFYRRRYDARRTLDAFNAQIKDEVDVERLSEALMAVVDETFRPAHVSLWLKKENS